MKKRHLLKSVTITLDERMRGSDAYEKAQREWFALKPFPLKEAPQKSGAGGNP